MRVTAAQDALARPLRQAGIDVGGSLGYFPAPRSDGEGALFRGVAQPGRAPGSGPGGRRFESCLPDHLKAAGSGTFPAGSRPSLFATPAFWHSDGPKRSVVRLAFAVSLPLKDLRTIEALAAV